MTSKKQTWGFWFEGVVTQCHRNAQPRTQYSEHDIDGNSSSFQGSSRTLTQVEISEWVEILNMATHSLTVTFSIITPSSKVYIKFSLPSKSKVKENIRRYWPMKTSPQIILDHKVQSVSKMRGVIEVASSLLCSKGYPIFLIVNKEGHESKPLRLHLIEGNLCNSHTFVLCNPS